jgi:HD-GYP domain-containing protein (c-di-GMP phosphodiesterase class II)
MPHAEARRIILQGRNQHFDSDIVDAFLQCEDEFVAIAARFEDKALQDAEEAANDELPTLKPEKTETDAKR